jgi:hypothetical protein
MINGVRHSVTDKFFAANLFFAHTRGFQHLQHGVNDNQFACEYGAGTRGAQLSKTAQT